MSMIADPIEHRAPSELLGALFAQAPGFMAVTRGADHHYVLVNEEYKRLCGRDPTGSTMAEALPELQGQGIVAMLDRVLVTGKAFVGRDVRVRLNVAGGWDELVLDFAAQPIRRIDGSFEDILCFGYDVTDRVREHERATRLQQELKRASQAAAMGTMASTLAHELNQPLAAAAAYLAGARRANERKLCDIAAESLAQAEAQVQRAGEIIRRTRMLLTDSRPRRERAALKAMIEDAAEVLRASGHLRDVALTIALEDAEIALDVDQVQIEQVLVNALRNACDAMAGAEHKRLEVAARTEGNHLHLQITDSGGGLARDIDPFEAFRSASGGLGIGLSISRTIVEAHGGSIRLDNAPSGGATLSLTLPLRAG
ncbi:sensor histidine kinase [Sphingosinicella sp. BN140058]|uniref:sensor histidine kinase n=1 Tax=Sphingosinicella sp. BN140058 TaxID=1892855 RepID=UPI001010D304|nr:ATP-binding protein [Sphingosinicella sp. BN140058]QAY77956.1 GHKL domain-containing protein [Sphingosinicella sp. BN140058]